MDGETKGSANSRCRVKKKGERDNGRNRHNKQGGGRQTDRVRISERGTGENGGEGDQRGRRRERRGKTRRARSDIKKEEGQK